MKTTIDQLIINSPYEEPARHWHYARETRSFSLHGQRRPAGYVVATPGSKAFDDPGIFVPLPLVNQIRPRVKAWREANYPGITGTTRRLLEHWRDPEARESRRLFFCQLEAIETLIWLIEAPPADRQGIDIPSDGGLFRRLCCKMATGSGKTIVMAMAITWQILNRVADGQGSQFCKNVLIIAPGLTVRKRLAVLIPDSPGNYYDAFNLIPPALAERLRQGRVLVMNWHKLDWESEEQLKKRRSVDKRGAKSDEAYVRDVLGEMANATGLLVINDEAHHAWRVNGPATGLSKNDVEQATKWIGGLDRIHRARGIANCFDFSATPFVPTGKKTTDETLFSWIISDFGLNDAIESGLVKTPRVVVRDDGVPDAKTYKSRLYHIYADPEVKDDLNRKAEPHEPLPDLVTNGYYLLGKDWLETAKLWQKHGHGIPPVMITVCNRTETAARVKYAFDHGKIRIEELRAPDRTLHIDSKVLEKAEAADEPVVAAEAAGAESNTDDADDEAPIRKLTRQEYAEQLRQIVDTVGQPGKPGQDVQAVIAVGMLSEGWDAKTVTHIMGLRAFSSQLLCEQVVGRGLRRTSYDVNLKTGLFEAEYVNIFGVPFTFLPHEGGDGPPPPPPPPKTAIEPVLDKQPFEIAWPNVLRIDHVMRPRLTLNAAKVPVLQLQAADTPTLVEIAPVVEGKPDVTRVSEIDLQQLGIKFRLQKVIFETAVEVYDLMKPSWKASKEYLLGQLIGLVEQFLGSGRIEISPPLFNQDEFRRRILLTLNMNKIVQHLWTGIRQENTECLELQLDRDNPIRSTGDMRAWYTGRPNELATRSHINRCVFDSTWESSHAFQLDRCPHVAAWVKNDHLGFEIVYVFRGVVLKYRPDFLIRLSSGKMLVLETKGRLTEQDRAKLDALREWCQAVNQHGGFGVWDSAVSESPSDILAVLTSKAD